MAKGCGNLSRLGMQHPHPKNTGGASVHVDTSSVHPKHCVSYVTMEGAQGPLPSFPRHRGGQGSILGRTKRSSRGGMWRSRRAPGAGPSPPLPPGEEGSSALEALCVRLAVGLLWGPRRLNNHGGQLHQLEGGFSVSQGLVEIQDLGKKGYR